MPYPILGTPKPAFFDSSGAPLASGTLSVLDPATDLNKASYPTYDDAVAETNANTSPVVLDSRGEPANELWGLEPEDYKLVLKDSTGNIIWTVDDVQIAIAGWATSNSEGDASVTPSNTYHMPGYIERYGGVADGTTDSTAALETAISVGRQNILFYETGRTDVLNTYTGRHRFYIIRDAFIDRANLIGPANFTSDGTQTNEVLRLGRDPDADNGFFWRRRRVQGITFSGKQRVDNAITLGGEDGAVDQYAQNWVIDSCMFERCNFGIRKLEGNFANRIIDCSASNCNYGYYAIGRSEASISHAGQDVITGGNWQGHRKAAFYINDENTSGGGGTKWHDVQIGGNRGFGIFLKNINNCPVPVMLDGVWFENNATDTTVDLSDIGEGAALTPRDLYAENVDMLVIRNSHILDVEWKDSNLVFYDCTFVTGAAPDTTTLLDSSTGTLSYAVAHNAHINGFGDNECKALVVESLARNSRKYGAQQRFLRVPERTKVIHTLPGTGTLVGGSTYEQGEDLIDTVGSNDRTATIVDGLTYPFASQYSLNDAAANWEVGALDSADSVTADKWVVHTREIRLDAGSLARLQLGVGATYTDSKGYELINDFVGEWRTIATVAEVNTGEGGIMRLLMNTTDTGTIVTLGASQTIEFDNAQEAYDYFNNKLFCDNKVGPWGRKHKAADESVSNSVTLQDDDHLAGWNLKADTKYKITGHISYTQNVGDLNVRFNFSQTTQQFSIQYLTDNSGATGTSYSFGDTDPTGGAALASTGGDGLDNWITVSGFVVTNATTGGTCDFQWAQDTSDANNTTLYEGSWLEFEEMPE
jgi:hypothetical protein